MAFDETKILEIVAEYIKDNPDSNIKNKIDEIFKLREINIYNPDFVD